MGLGIGRLQRISLFPVHPIFVQNRGLHENGMEFIDLLCKKPLVAHARVRGASPGIRAYA